MNNGVTIEQAQADKSLEAVFVEENMGLVNAAIKKLGSIWKEDYVQEGCIGLIKAIRKFDPQYGTQFSTFAMYHITGQIQKYKRDFEIDGVVGIHISRTIKDIYYIIKKHENKTDEEIAKQYNCKLDNVKMARLYADNICASLDKHLYDADSSNKKIEMYEVIADNSDVENYIIEKIVYKQLLEHLSKRLSEKDFRILCLRLQGLSQPKIAQKVGVSQAQVSRILRKTAEIIQEYARQEVV